MFLRCGVAMASLGAVPAYSGRLDGSDVYASPAKLSSTNGYFVGSDRQKVINMREFFKFAYLDSDNDLVEPGERNFFVYGSGEPVSVNLVDFLFRHKAASP